VTAFPVILAARIRCSAYCLTSASGSLPTSFLSARRYITDPLSSKARGLAQRMDQSDTGHGATPNEAIQAEALTPPLLVLATIVRSPTSGLAACDGPPRERLCRLAVADCEAAIHNYLDHAG
jgi:hypothetical protein